MNMRKIVYLIAIILLLSSCTHVVTEPLEVSVNPFQFDVGLTCSAYIPDGQYIYESDWTGEYPEIEKYDKDYKTATFGLG